MVKRLQLLIIIFLSVYLQAKAQPVIYSIQAHQDDWQLFMSSKIVSDLSSGSKVVFITLTAGDASCGTCSYSPAGPYYLSREKGSVYSSKFAADLTTVSAPLDIPTAETVTINSKNITKYTYKNTVNYFFRLPDGGNGDGFPSTGNQSLKRLRDNGITMTVLGQTGAAYTYTWIQLVTTLRQIVLNEKINGRQAWAYSASLNTTSNTFPNDSTYNPNDHSDHIYSSMAIREAVTGSPTPANNLPWVGLYSFVDYYSQFIPLNLSPAAHANASIIFGLAAFGITESEYQNDFNTTHQDWIPGEMYGVTRYPSGVASFSGELENSKNIIPNTSGEPDQLSLTEIPMAVSVTGPVSIDKDINMRISPSEPGELATSVYDMAGNKVYDLKTKVENNKPLILTLTGAIKTKGTYVLENILNDKYIESLKIVAE